eukprot:345299-Pyramimonas_sp.AAC.1
MYVHIRHRPLEARDGVSSGPWPNPLSPKTSKSGRFFWGPGPKTSKSRGAPSVPPEAPSVSPRRRLVLSHDFFGPNEVPRRATRAPRGPQDGPRGP